jgi:hypothetical protein
LGLEKNEHIAPQTKHIAQDLRAPQGTHLLSLAFISSTTSQSNRASFDVGPCVLLASRAASMALAVALSESGTTIDRREIGAGAKAAEDEMRAATRRSFMMVEFMNLSIVSRRKNMLTI